MPRRQGLDVVMEAPDLPKEVEDNIRARLPIPQIFQTNVVCKRWALVTKSSEFCRKVMQQLAGGDSSPTTPAWMLELYPLASRKEVRCRVFDSSKGDRRCLAAGMLPLGSWSYGSEAGGTGGTYAAAAGGLVAFICTGGQYNVILVANPLLPGSTKVLPPPPPFEPSVTWFASTLAMVYDAANDSYKVLVTGKASKQEFAKLRQETFRRVAFQNLIRTAVYCSSSKCWQTRVSIKQARQLNIEASLAVGDMVYLVLSPRALSLTFSARNIHDLLSDSECSDIIFPEFSSLDRLWPYATWRGVPIRMLDLTRPWCKLQLVDCLGHLLLLVFYDNQDVNFEDLLQIFQFDPAHCVWLICARMPPEILETCFPGPLNTSMKSIQSFCYMGAVHILNLPHGVGVSFDPLTQCWSVDVEPYVPPSSYDHAVGLALEPSLRSPSTYFSG